MAFTGKLGTASSKLKFIKLAAGAAQVVITHIFTGKIGSSRSRLSNIKLGVSALVTEIINQDIAFVQSDTAVDTRFTSNTLTFTQTVTALHLHIVSVSQTLTFTQTPVTARTINQSVHQTLILNQLAQRSAVFGRSASNQLIFNRTMSKTLGNQSFTISPAMVTKVPGKCMVILRGNGLVITLNCPDLGDTQGFSGGKMLLKNAITGDQYTYIRRTSNNLIKYTFRMIRAKSLELKNFLKANLANVIIMTNFKGETWAVIINNNPVEMVPKSRWDPCGERVDVTLEFEGIKLY